MPKRDPRLSRTLPPVEPDEEVYDDEVVDPEEPEDMDWESTTERQPEFFERLRRRLSRVVRYRPWRSYGIEE